MIDLHIAFEFTLAAIAAIIGLASSHLLVNIREDSQLVMTEFKLGAEETALDFKGLLVGELILLVVFALYPIAGILGNHLFIQAARGLLLVFTLIVSVVFIRQWRRSRSN